MRFRFAVVIPVLVFCLGILGEANAQFGVSPTQVTMDKGKVLSAAGGRFVFGQISDYSSSVRFPTREKTSSCSIRRPEGCGASVKAVTWECTCAPFLIEGKTENILRPRTGHQKLRGKSRQKNSSGVYQDAERTLLGVLLPQQG